MCEFVTVWLPGTCHFGLSARRCYQRVWHWHPLALDRLGTTGTYIPFSITFSSPTSFLCQMDGAAMIRPITPTIAGITWLRATDIEPGQLWDAFKLGCQDKRHLDVGLSQNLSSPSSFEFSRRPWDHRTLPLQHAEVYIPLLFSPTHLHINQAILAERRSPPRQERTVLIDPIHRPRAQNVRPHEQRPGQ
jgi:hypothetical protein